MPILFIRLAFDETYEDLPCYAPNANIIKSNRKFLIGNPETAFIPELDFRIDKDIILNKKYGDPFHGSGLLDVLLKLNSEEIIFTGIATDNAIINGANTAITNNFKVIVISDACGAQNAEHHELALKIMKGRTASEITTTAEYLTQIE